MLIWQPRTKLSAIATARSTTIKGVEKIKRNFFGDNVWQRIIPSMELLRFCLCFLSVEPNPVSRWMLLVCGVVIIRSLAKHFYFVLLMTFLLFRLLNLKKI